MPESLFTHRNPLLISNESLYGRLALKASALDEAIALRRISLINPRGSWRRVTTQESDGRLVREAKTLFQTLNGFLNWHKLSVQNSLFRVGWRLGHLQLSAPGVYLEHEDHERGLYSWNNQVNHVEHRADLEHMQAGLFTHLSAQGIEQRFTSFNVPSWQCPFQLRVIAFLLPDQEHGVSLAQETTNHHESLFCLTVQ